MKLTKDQAIEEVGHFEQWELFEGVVADPSLAFEDLCDYFFNMPENDDDYPIVMSDIINRIESCGFADDYEAAVKLAILGEHQTPQWNN